MIGSRLIKSNDVAAGCEDIVDNYDPFDGNGVALYQLNGNADDVSGNYNGTASNVIYGTGVFGQAGVFNGSNSKITASSSITGNSARTISVWYKTTSTDNILVSLGTSSAVNNSQFSLAPKTNSLSVYGYVGSGANVDEEMTGFSTNLISGNWTHLVVSWDGLNPGTLRAYVNGALESTLTRSSGEAYNTSAGLQLGTWVFGNRWLNGSLDQVRIFNTALDPLEIEALYTEELCICSGTVDTLDILGDGSCIATYQLDGNANDLSGNYSGTPTNVSYGVGEFDLAGNFKALQGNIVTPVGVYNNSFSGHSVSFWMYSGGTNYETPFYTRTAANPAAGWYIRTSTNGNGINWSWQNSSGSVVFGSSELSFTFVNSWHHVVATWDGTTNTNGAKLYIDNSLFDQRTANATLASQTFSLGATLGSDRQSAGRSIQGLDQVRIFNKALNSTEVTTLYNETACANTTREAGVTQILGDSSCVAYYKLDGTAADETGTYDGTFTNPNYGNGEFDFAGIFNGTSSYITTPITYNSIVNLNDKTQDFSLSLWMYQSSLPSAGTKNVFAINEFAPSYQYIGLVVNGSNINFVSYPGGASGDVAVTTTDLNVWTHIACVRESSTMKIYKNGSLIQSTPMVYPNMSLDSTLRWVFGRRSDGGNDNYFNGLIDQVRFFNKAVSPSEVTTLYDEGI